MLGYLDHFLGGSQSRVPPADYRHPLAGKYGAIADGTVGHSSASEPFLAGDIQRARPLSGGDNQRLRLIGCTIIGLNLKPAIYFPYVRSTGPDLHLQGKLPHLLLELLHQLRALNELVAHVVLNPHGPDHLSPDVLAQEQGLNSLPGCIDRSRHSRRPTTDDN